MTLSTEQIEHLFLFVEKKMVRYYDLQVELVDHLANMIEEIVEKDPNLSFEVALKKAYTSFGLFGFAHIVQEKQSALEVKYKRMWWQELKNQFRWPELILSITIIVTSWFLVKNVQLEILWTVFVVTWVTSWVLHLSLIRQPKKKGKRLLMLQCYPATHSLFHYFLQFLGWSFVFSKNAHLATMVFVSAAIIEIATFRLFIKIRNDARELFPEAFLRSA